MFENPNDFIEAKTRCSFSISVLLMVLTNNIRHFSFIYTHTSSLAAYSHLRDFWNYGFYGIYKFSLFANKPTNHHCLVTKNSFHNPYQLIFSDILII